MKSTILEIQNMFENLGQNAYFGEEITQLQHALQCYQLAENEGCDIEMQIAAFLHDLGHMISENNMGDFGNQDHESIAQNWLKSHGFSERIQIVVFNHVKAKRYLCFANKDYFDGLSNASKKTLIFQGGIMNEIEAKSFEESPYFDDSLLLRKWDDLAKIPDATLPDLQLVFEKISEYLNNLQYQAS